MNEMKQKECTVFEWTFKMRTIYFIFIICLFSSISCVKKGETTGEIMENFMRCHLLMR